MVSFGFENHFLNFFPQLLMIWFSNLVIHLRFLNSMHFVVFQFMWVLKLYNLRENIWHMEHVFYFYGIFAQNSKNMNTIFKESWNLETIKHEYYFHEILTDNPYNNMYSISMEPNTTPIKLDIELDVKLIEFFKSSNSKDLCLLKGLN